MYSLHDLAPARRRRRNLDLSWARKAWQFADRARKLPKQIETISDAAEQAKKANTAEEVATTARWARYAVGGLAVGGLVLLARRR